MRTAKTVKSMIVQNCPSCFQTRSSKSKQINKKQKYHTWTWKRWENWWCDASRKCERKL